MDTPVESPATTEPMGPCKMAAVPVTTPSPPPDGFTKVGVLPSPAAASFKPKYVQLMGPEAGLGGHRGEQNVSSCHPGPLRRSFIQGEALGIGEHGPLLCALSKVKVLTSGSSTKAAGWWVGVRRGYRSAPRHSTEVLCAGAS